MIILPNGCYCSEPKVSPITWNKKGASTNKPWSIQYRFYDPFITDEHGKTIPKQVIIKNMNLYKDLGDRRAVCKQLLENELDLLKNKGYNPHTKIMLPEVQQFYEIDPSTPFIDALRYALKKVTGVQGTLNDMSSVITGVEKAGKQLGFNKIPISQISRKYIKAILERCRETNKRFSACRHNKYRAYLMRLFKELVAMETIDVNPIRDVAKMKETTKMRLTLTMDQRKEINDRLHSQHYEFWRVIQIFFHSGSRVTEMMKVQAKHVDLAGQRCLYTVMKGTEIREVYRPIKDVILPLWLELLNNALPDDYLISEALVPGPLHIRPDQLTRRWWNYIKKPVDKGGMNIQCDLYSLKHLNTTETIDLLGEVDAAKQNEHTTPIITIKNYDINKDKRQHDRLVKLGNSFSG